jgi:AraC family transcriptional regulator, regulatory protein of adaptative response / DNA-3-methyladenine glycosylase II
MELIHDVCYRALTARDSRFDGQFFVAVTSTRIYCRPVCRVKVPRSANCLFFTLAAQAEESGYRPCLRCRPELAPGRSVSEFSDEIAIDAKALIDAGHSSSQSDMAARLGVSQRHLRRVFQEQFGVAPIQYDQTQRLLPMSAIAQTSGFSSVRRFNALFLARYRLAPSRLRKVIVEQTKPVSLPAHLGQALTVYLSYRPPYDWAWMIQFLAARSIGQVEQISQSKDGPIYSRTLQGGWLRVGDQPTKSRLKVQLSLSDLSSLRIVLIQLRQLFDLDCEPSVVQTTLAPLADQRPGIRLPGAFDPFEVCVRAILGQQITVKAATTLAGRFALEFGKPIKTDVDGLSACFPSSKVVAKLEYPAIAHLGIIAARAKAIIALAQAIETKAIVLARARNQDQADHLISQLKELPGIGEWTAQYIAMRALAWPDAFVASDLIVLKVLRLTKPIGAIEKAKQWRPYRAYAVMHLWNQSK